MTLLEELEKLTNNEELVIRNPNIAAGFQFTLFRRVGSKRLSVSRVAGRKELAAAKFSIITAILADMRTRLDLHVESEVQASLDKSQQSPGPSQHGVD